MESIPTVSLSQAGTQQLSEAVLDACTGCGFFYLTDVPIREELVEAAWSASQTFFLDSSQEGIEAKDQSRDRDSHTGYTGLQEEKLDLDSGSMGSKGKQGDLKESFYIARLASTTQPPQTLPPTLQSHQDELSELFEGCREVCATINKAFASALGLCDDFFTSRHHARDDRLRLIHYPPAKVDESESSTIRAGSHSDYGTITLLFQKGVSGLQVQRHEDGEWIDIPPKEKTIVVNVGDALEFWTAAVFRSTQHRVVMPRSREETVSRFSMAYFCQPDDDALLEPLSDRMRPIKPIRTPSRSDYEAVLQRKGIDVNVRRLTGGQHLQSRLRSTYE